MLSKLQIFQKRERDDSISRIETHTHHPQVRSFDYNNEIEILLNQRDIWYDISNAILIVEGKFIPDPVADGEGRAGGEVKLSNNFIAALFERVSYELFNTEVDFTNDPVILSTIRACVTLNRDEAKSLEIAGFSIQKSPEQLSIYNATTQQFRAQVPLSHLLTLPYDYKSVLCGQHKFKFIRSRNDDNCYVSTGTRKAKIELTNMSLQVPHVFPNDVIKLSLLEAINNDKAVEISFRKVELFQKPAAAVSRTDLWRVTTTNQTQRPLAILVAFQTNRVFNPNKNVTEFDHVNLRSLRVQLNSDNFPIETWNLDFSKNNYTEAYQALLDFHRMFTGNDRSSPIIDLEEFKKRPIFIIPCTKQPDPILSSTNDITIAYEATENFPENTRVYCITIYDQVLNIQLLTGILTPAL